LNSFMNKLVISLTIFLSLALACSERELNNIYDRQSLKYRLNVSPLIDSVIALDHLFVDAEILMVAYARDFNKDPINLQWEVDTGTIVSSATEDTIIWHTPATRCSARFTIKAYDLFLHDSITVGFWIDTIPRNHAPRIIKMEADPPVLGSYGRTTLTTEAYDYDGDVISYFWSSPVGSFPDGTHGATVTWVAPAEPSIYFCRVKATDGDLSDEGGVAVIVSGPPIIDSFAAEPPNPRVEDTVAIKVNASDPENDYLYYRWETSEGSLVGLSFMTSVAVWRLPNETGVYPIWVTVNDGLNEASDTFYLAVRPPNRPPTVDGVWLEPRWIRPGETTQAWAIASDPDEDPVTIHWSAPIGSFPGGAQNDTVLWRAPTNLRRVTIVRLTAIATDSEAEGSKNIEVTVVPVEVNLAPPIRIIFNENGDAIIEELPLGVVDIP